MKQWKRLIYYLMLNVLISACTTLTVLIIWDQTYSPASGGFLPLTLNRGDPTQIAAPPASLVETPAPQPSATPQYKVHVVQPNDTFDSIAQTFGVRVEDLMAVNGFTDPTGLGVGEQLLVPVPAPPGEEPGVIIENVVGAGDLASERVLLKRTGKGDLSLVNWVLHDQDGNSYTFPQLTLYEGGAVEVHTKAGVDEVVTLYWGLEEPVWQQEEKVTLLNGLGEERATFTIR